MMGCFRSLCTCSDMRSHVWCLCQPLQIEMQALRSCEVTVVLELLHGLYYADFVADMVNLGDLYVHSPNRAFYPDKKVSPFFESW
jgi:hypothetical protein